MRPPFARLAAALALGFAGLLAATPATAAGTVQVQFVAPERFSDAGDVGRDREANLKRLAQHLQALGEHTLADGQTLRIEVLDVDLAGRVKHMGSRGDVRLLKGGADWPRIDLRYVLDTPGVATLRGEEHLADLNYLQQRPAQRLAEPLPYEKAMLDAWFKRRFATALP